MLNFRIEQTCMACPEQYEVFMNDEHVAYLRLRHGNFTVEMPDCGGELVYHAQPKGDGGFYDDERAFYLGEALKAIVTRLGEKISEELDRICGFSDI